LCSQSCAYSPSPALGTPDSPDPARYAYLLVHDWRVSQLARLRLPELLAEGSTPTTPTGIRSRDLSSGCRVLPAMRTAC
jgi:hypothetical protein